MRSAATVIAGLAFLALGCGSTRGSTGTGTTGGQGATTGGMTVPTDGGKQPGAPCLSNSDCDSTFCGAQTDAGGYCCVEPCAPGKAPCQVLGCDGNGACYYPGTETLCDPYASYCIGNALVIRACNEHGGCETLSASSCLDNFACNNEGAEGNYDAGFDAGCNTTCASSTDCARTYVCNGGACVAPASTGACTENDDCYSGACGIDGAGHCCSEPCDSTPPCGATDCDPDTGACLYPDNSIACAPYACGPNACLATCVDDGGCASGAFCCDGGCSASFCGTAG